MNLDGLVHLQSAVHDFAAEEAKRIVRAVIDEMCGQSANGTFDEVAARHLWDEYCWSLQEGPFDDDMGWDDVELGSLSGAFDGLVSTMISAEIEKLPRYAQIFLTAKAVEDDPDMDAQALGSIWEDGIAAMILEALNEEASNRNLDLIGPDRGEVIDYVIDGDGTVWSTLSDRGEAADIMRAHVDTLIDPDGDLAELAEEMAKAYLAAALEEADGPIVADLLDCYYKEMCRQLVESDVLPGLEYTRSQLLRRLDG